MNLINHFITINEAKKTITLKEGTTVNNVFVKKYIAKGYTIKEN